MSGKGELVPWARFAGSIAGSVVAEAGRLVGARGYALSAKVGEV